MSLLMMSFGLTPLATLPISWLAEEFGAPIVVALASGLMLVFAVALPRLQPRSPPYRHQYARGGDRVRGPGPSRPPLERELTPAAK